MKTILLWNLCILNHQHCIKASGKRTSLEPLQVKHAVTQISLIRYFGSASNQTDCKYFETITSSEFISSTQVCFKRHSAECLYVANVQSPLQSSNWSANILNLNWPFRILPIFTYEQFCECNENLSQQVPIILRKLRRFSRLNFQWLQSRLNLAIVSLFLKIFAEYFEGTIIFEYK